MSDQNSSSPAADLVRAALQRAVLHGPVLGPDAARPPLPRSLWARGPLIAALTLLTIGFTAGSIAVPMETLHRSADESVPLGLLQAAPLVVALFRPLLAWRVSAAGLLLGALLVRDAGFWPWSPTAWLAFLIILFCVGTAGDRTAALGVGMVTVAGVIGPAVTVAMPVWFGVILSALALLALVFGDAVGGRRAAERALREQEELHRRDLARQAVLEERARIARELHDVVAHHMSVIAMQAEAAPYKIPELPEQARETFVVVRDAARQALAETRRVVGLLRAEDEAAERAPQPGLDGLDGLLEAARHSGLAVTSSVTGMPRPLATGVDLSAFRIVQESLSNASRYAPGGTVRVEIGYGDERLAVAVRDEGPGPGGEPESSGGGHGLVGMRERVAMLGGTLAAGRRGDGRPGWEVEAELPYGDPD
ncbi:sensor histidine kinase [Actinomadura rupiterrae]|uniref:sensor histidine kinase n=1 Tax=Actinomadura rupiterrae TaxID=559627 RepID=UPI0020A36537|nr:histidine kinase [Actinomadura rupiterrae]MCP2340881.1 signal transduction histidine kinase [Actinomadura rupiterrae]